MRVSTRSDYIVDTTQLETQIAVLKTILQNLELELHAAQYQSVIVPESIL